MASHSSVTSHCEAVPRQDHSSIEYIYAADGTKLRTIHRPASSTALTDSIDYVGNLILKNGQPSMYIFDGGYVSFGTNGAVDGWHYYIQDYMGNNRMVVNKNGTIEQVTHYYPYGGVIGDISTNENVQKYKFEGKELDRTFGLDNYDIHARHYFAMMPSWDRIDRKAEDYYPISPYAYCGGDPVNHGDYNGMEINADSCSQNNILQGLAPVEQDFVRFDENGNLDVNLLGSAPSFSPLLSQLYQLAKSNVKYIFKLAPSDGEEDFFEKDENGNWYYGVTRVPGAEKAPSPDDNVYVYTASFLDPERQVTNTFHEGLGHAYYAELKRTNHAISYNHDRELKTSDDFTFYFELTNLNLESQIRCVEEISRLNYKLNNSR